MLFTLGEIRRKNLTSFRLELEKLRSDCMYFIIANNKFIFSIKKSFIAMKSSAVKDF